MANRHFSHSGGVDWAWIAALAIGAFFLFTEHRAHPLGILPYLLLASLALLLFLGGGHGHGGPHDAKHPSKGADQ